MEQNVNQKNATLVLPSFKVESIDYRSPWLSIVSMIFIVFLIFMHLSLRHDVSVEEAAFKVVELNFFMNSSISCDWTYNDLREGIKFYQLCAINVSYVS